MVVAVVAMGPLAATAGGPRFSGGMLAKERAERSFRLGNTGEGCGRGRK